MRVEPYKREHLAGMRIQEAQANCLPTLDKQVGELESLPAVTIFDGDLAVACVGAFEIWPGRAIVWSYLSDDARSRLLGITRIARKLMDHYDRRRLECEVAFDFEAGHRWARMLGFEVEAPRMRSYFPDGGDCTLYAKVK